MKPIASLFVLIAVTHAAQAQESTARENSHALPVKTISLKKSPQYREKRFFTGRIEARQTSNQGFEIGGRLISIYVDEGDEVSVNDVLAQLDTDRLQAARKEAAAALEEANAALSLSESTLRRIKAALSIKAVSYQEMDVAQESRNTAAAAVNRQKAALERIDVDIEKSSLKSTFDGIVIRRIADQGRVIAAGTPILRIQENTIPQARIALANEFADSFNIGDTVTLATYNDRLLATVKAILPVRDIRTRTVDVIFDLLEDENVRPGDAVEISMKKTVRKIGFWTPLSALTETVRGLWSVYVINDDKTAQRKVVDLLYQDEDRAFVRGNLHDGEIIIADGVHRLVPGQTVRPVGQ